MALEDAKKQVDQAFTRDDLRGLTFENAFGGAPSFLRRKYSKDLSGVDVAITGIPFDQAVTNRTGTRLGPRAVREASSLQPSIRRFTGTATARWRRWRSWITAIWHSIMPRCRSFPPP